LEIGITVNGILLGIIRTDRVVQLAKDRAVREGKTLEETLSEYTKSIPLGHLGEPELAISWLSWQVNTART